MIDGNIILFLMVAGFVVFGGIYLITLVNILGNDSIGGSKKLLWIILVISAPLLGILLYYLIE